MIYCLYEEAVHLQATARSRGYSLASTPCWVVPLGLNMCVERFDKHEDTSQNSLMTHLTTLRHSEEWLGEQPVVPQQQAIRDFIAAKKRSSVKPGSARS